LTLAHIINPVRVEPTSDLFLAQPITFESMRRAREFASAEVQVEIFSAHYPEDASMMPEGFIATPHLERSILDFGKFTERRKLPLMREIGERLYEASRADYFIYTNADIALMPGFYLAVRRLIEQGYDAFVINRRTITRDFTTPADLPLMYAQIGEPHPGHDCFVWRREVFPRFRLENICVGTIGIGKAIILNQLCTSRNFRESTDLHLTFHLGADRVWLNPSLADYRAFNLGELRKIVSYHREHGTLPDHPLVARFTSNLRV